MSIRNKLKNLMLKELSLVDRGANQHALQVLRKRNAGGSLLSRLLKSVAGADQGVDGTEELSALSDALTVSINDVIEKSETPEELEANLTETLDQYKAHLLKAATADDDMDGDEDLGDGEVGTDVPPGKKPTGAPKKPVKKDATPDAGASSGESHQEPNMNEKVLKGLSPEGVAYIQSLEKRATDAQAAADSALKLAQDSVAKHADTIRINKARTLVGESNLNVDDVALLLKHAEGNDVATAAIEKMVKQQVELVEKSGLFEEQGSDSEETPSATNAMESLNKRAAELKKANPKLSIQKCMSMAMDENPEAYEDVVDPLDAK